MQILQYLIIDTALILLILFILLVLFYKGILTYLDGLINSIRKFIYRNDSFFTLLFLFIFFIEQLILMILANFFRESVIRLQFIISIFALIVVTTSSIQKLILDIRVRYFKEQSEVLEGSYKIMKEIFNRYKSKILKKK